MRLRTVRPHGCISIADQDHEETTVMSGTEGASDPFFSPNSRWVGFRVGNGLKRVLVDDGEVRTIAVSGPTLLSSPATWTEDDTILVAADGGIYESRPAEAISCR